MLSLGGDDTLAPVWWLLSDDSRGQGGKAVSSRNHPDGTALHSEGSPRSIPKGRKHRPFPELNGTTGDQGRPRKRDAVVERLNPLPHLQKQQVGRSSQVIPGHLIIYQENIS